MLKNLITGENSYIGNQFAKWVEKYPDKYSIQKISLRDKNWRTMDWSQFDTIIHVSGIAHRRETLENESEYFKINRDLTIEVATKAKKEGVRQFIFISTMSVYGKAYGKIDSNTQMKPVNAYGLSKLEAEEKLKELASNIFKLYIIRPPMVYGPNCPGNYSKMSKFVKKTRIFPAFHNKRSMIFIDNLSELIRLVIDFNLEGEINPQNEKYINVSEMINLIGEVNNFRIINIPLIQPLFSILGKNMTIYNKIFGDLYYDQAISELSTGNEKINYNVIEFKETVRLTEDA